MNMLSHTYQTLEEIAADIRTCRKCRLHEQRQQAVPGAGKPDARLVFIGEGPGKHEDEQGLPFVGRAGRILTEMLEGIGLSREQVFITNLVKCRPPRNRNPREDEVSACEPYLHAQLRLMQPEIICVLGTSAASALLQTKDSITKIRGQWFSYRKIPVLPTFHPAYVLRKASKKMDTQEDFQELLRKYRDLHA